MASLRYITTEDLLQKVPQSRQGLLTNDGSSLNPKSDILTDAILEAEGEFESWVAQRYDLPVQAADGTVPPNVKSKIVTLAKYHLYARRDAISKEIQEQYNAAVKWLRGVSNGSVTIPILDASDNVEDDGAIQITVSEKSDDNETKTQFGSFV